jgi:alkanesulfonate monooxygenase SsuD/methylene tetrahydromethanopterin reductase-like flavin-dependent oxidoreductase (luciferase family)
VKIGVQVIRSRDRRAIDLAKRADAAGFNGLWLAGGGDNYVKAALLLAATENITVGTSITPALLASPAFHASISGYLQEISDGRFVLGFGSQTKGQLRAELGTEFPKIAKQAKEVIEITRGILSGQPVDYDGEFYHRHGLGRRALTDGPAPPIYYSGVGPLNLRIAGEFTDGFLAHPIFTRKYYEDVVWPRIDEGLARAGKSRASFEMVAMPMTLVVESEDERPALLKRAKRNLAFYFTTRAYGTFMDLNGWSAQREALWEVAARAGRDARKFDYQALEDCITEDMVAEVCLLGTAEEIRRAARQRYDGIADYLDFYPMHDSSDTPAAAAEREYETIGRFITAFAAFNK